MTGSGMNKTWEHDHDDVGISELRVLRLIWKAWHHCFPLVAVDPQLGTRPQREGSTVSKAGLV